MPPWSGRRARRDGVVFKARVEAAEWLGSEQFAYLPFEAPSELSVPLPALARELDRESPRGQLVVSHRSREPDPRAGARRTCGSTRPGSICSTPRPAGTSPGRERRRPA